MIKRFSFVFILVIFSAALFQIPATAKEDTAQIKLKKTAVPAKKLYTYKIKKGDTISNIVRNIPGITEADIANNYQIVRELNPRLKNMNKLEVGQLIVLPGRPVTAGQETQVATSQTSPDSPSDFSYYKIRRGDTLYNIARQKMQVSATDIPQTFKAILAINPSIKNINKIYAGTVVKLPGETVFVKKSEDVTPVPQETVLSMETSEQPKKIVEIKEKKSMPPEARLAVLKQIVNQMNGTIMTSGNYYLPIPNAGQVTIDCSKIPLVEFDDSSIVFVDLDNLAHSNLKKMIGENWNNYSLVKMEREDDIFAVLKKVIHGSKNYTMIKSEKPLTIGSLPPIEVIVDWIILKSDSKQQSRPIQGLRSIFEDNVLFPRSIKNYAEKNGLTITEISEESGIVGKPEELYALPPIPVFPSTSSKDLSHALLSHLGMTVEKDVEVQVFDTVKDGFNLSIKADALVKKDKQYIIYSQTLSQQFTNALKQAGYETIFVNDIDAPRKIIEDVLRGLDIPCTYGSFIFSGLERNQAPYALKFNGIRINQNLYVVDFDMDSDMRGLLQEIWSADIARY